MMCTKGGVSMEPSMEIYSDIAGQFVNITPQEHVNRISMNKVSHENEAGSMFWIPPRCFAMRQYQPCSAQLTVTSSTESAWLYVWAGDCILQPRKLRRK